MRGATLARRAVSHLSRTATHLSSRDGARAGRVRVLSRCVSLVFTAKNRGDLRSNISSAQDGEGSENFCCAVFSLPRWSAEQGRAPPPPRLSSSSACVLFAGSGNERVEHGVRPRRVDRGGVVCPTEAKTAPFGSASWQRHHSSQHGASGYAAAFECADVRGTVDWAAHHGAATTREPERTNCCAAQRKQKQGSATQVTDLRDGRLRDLHRAPRSGATRR